MPRPVPARLPALRFVVALALALLVGLFPVAVSARPVFLEQAQSAQQATSPDAQTQAATVQQAYEMLMDRFVHPIDSATLLGGAWAGIAREAARVGAPAPGPGPSFDGNRADDGPAFRTAFLAYLARIQNPPPGFTPAYAAIRGMVGVAGEGHTYFLDPQQYQDQQAWSRGDVHYVGVGARMKGPPLTIVEVFQGSPAASAGLRAGDVVVQVNGQSIQSLPLDQTVSLIRGPEGSSVSLLVQRPGETDPLSFDVQRGEITLDFVTGRMLTEGVGYILLRGFPEPGVVDSFDAQVASLQSQGARSLVLDLRGNSGGRLDVGTRLLSRFLPAGTNLYEEVDRQGRQQTRASRDAARYGLPVVVLVDGGTASMGEIFAAALQERGVAAIVGQKTSGNVAAAQVFPLGDGSALQVTVMEILSGTGRTLNGVGVLPDDPVDVDPASEQPGDDPTLAEGVAVLERESTS